MNMKNIFKHIIFISLLFLAASCFNADRPVPVCRVEDNKVIFRLDNRWDTAKLKEISFLYDLESSVFIQAFENRKGFVNDGEVWKVKRISSNLIDLSKPIESFADTLIVNGYVFMINEQLAGNRSKILSGEYGINIMFCDNSFKYSDGEAFFWLPGYQEAETVILSGTFNNWSTSEIVMSPCDSGWIARVKLKPGKYAYKYIIDDNWTPDPLNSLKEDDLNGGFNSFVYCNNYVFRINGMKEAKEVRLTGDFLNWNQAGINMKQTNYGWELPIYLREGTYAYKFISGKEWFTDPLNPDVRNDGSGNMNSFITIGEKHIFTLKGYEGASSVFLAGTFNNWDPTLLPFTKSENGWTTSCAFPAGNYEYKFVIDGRWMPDPSNENTTGSGDYINSLLCFKPNHVFALSGYQNAKEVIVTGSFNKFNNEGYRMSKKDGKWVLPVYLAPGKTIYKFIVDGEWILDPGNELWEDNEYGTGNSVVWIEPQ